MDIRNTSQLKSDARKRLENARDEKKLVLIYAGVMLGMSVLSALLDVVLNLRSSQYGGLSGMSSLALLSTIRGMLPLAQAVVAMCMGLGYLAAMLRISRGQYASPNTLRLGFQRFWPLLRLTLLKTLMCMGIGLVSSYIASMIFLALPAARPFLSAMMQMSSQTSLLSPGVTMDEETMLQLSELMMPALYISIGIFCLVAVPVMFRYRMAEYVMIDKPALGAFAALRESRRMMRGRCRSVLRVDLSLWPYYLAMVAAAVVGYGDLLLPALGVALPISREGLYYLSFGAYLLAQLAIYYWMRNRVEVTYAMTYDAIRPREAPGGGVVLGNIFQM